MAAKKIGLVAASALVAVNVWVGSPLLAVWVGSQVQGGSGLSMVAVFVVIAVLALLVLTLTWVLTWLNSRYDRLVGKPPQRRKPAPWLRSMRGESEAVVRHETGISAVERVVVVTVVVAVLAFEIWFFFFAGSSLPAQ